jgi:isoleucyl-tRNA synthetase
MLEKWIKPSKVKEEEKKKWKTFFKIKDVVFAKLEELRKEGQIKKNNQANVIITFNNEADFSHKELAKYLNVAQVKIIDTKHDSITCEASATSHIRCERCWNYFPEEEINEEHICTRCAKVIKK